MIDVAKLDIALGGLALLTLAVVLGLLQFARDRRARAHAGWRSVQGLVIGRAADEAGRPTLRVAYVVGGVRHETSLAATGDELPSGATVRVFFDPLEPRRATLERRAAAPDATLGRLAGIAAAGAVVLFALSFVGR